MRVVAISADPQEESLKLAESLKVPFPLLSDHGMQVMSAYGVADAKRDIAVPALFILNRDGMVIWERVGESIADTPSVEKLLKVIDTHLPRP